MVLVNPPTAVAPFDTGRLAAGISAAATTITVAPIQKTVNGVRTKQGFDTTSGLALITQGDFTERISFEGASVNATTKVTTLTTCTRGLSTTSTTPSFSGGTGRAWPKGAKITVVADASYFQSSVYTTVPNSFSAKQTFAAGADFTSVTRPPKLPTLSQVQENALTPEEGMMWKNSNTGTNRQYVSGSIVDIGDTGTPNGSTTVAGKFEEATVAEQGSATATGATGARLVPAVANLVKTSSGASDENKIPLLQADGALHINHIATGTPDGTKFVRDDGTLATPSLTSTDFVKPVQLFYANTSGVGTSSTASVDVPTHQYTIPANDLIGEVGYKFFWAGTITWGAGTVNMRVQLGSTAIMSVAPIPNAKCDYIIDGEILGTGAAGASVAVRGKARVKIGSSATFVASDQIDYGTANVATNGSLVLKLNIDFTSNNASNSFVSSIAKFEKFSTAAF